MENKFANISKLHMEASYKAGQTYLSDLYFTAPFKIMKPFPWEKDGLKVMLLTASAGLMEGDTQELFLDIQSHAKVEFVSQAYEKIHKMNAGFAKRKTDIQVGRDATFYYHPLPTIPFANSGFESEMNVELEDETAKFSFSEVMSCGRAGCGERFLYRFYKNVVRVHCRGKLIYQDRIHFTPNTMQMEDFGMYEGYTHQSNLVLFHWNIGEESLENTAKWLSNEKNVLAGITTTAYGAVAVKMLGNRGDQLTQLNEEIRERLSQQKHGEKGK